VTATVPPVPVDPALSKRLSRTSQKAKDYTAERNRLIVEAHAAGGGVREIARLVGLTHPAVLRILAKAQPPP
jgi:hypothetical protein